VWLVDQNTEDIEVDPVEDVPIARRGRIPHRD
jgi:hypothetical protein